MDKRVMRFTASWCQPCKMLAKNLESVNTDVPIEVYDIDERTDVAMDFGIRGVPTLVMMDGNTEVKRMVGMKSLKELEDWMIWIEISKERSNKEFVNKNVEEDMLKIIKKQFSELSEIQIALSRLMTHHSALLANNKYIEIALSKIRQKVGALGEIEKLTSRSEEHTSELQSH